MNKIDMTSVNETTQVSFEEELCSKYGKIKWGKMKKEYAKEMICLDIEDYRDLLHEERGLYKELIVARKKLEEGNVNDEYFMDLIAGICHEISKNADVQIEVLANIRGNLKKIEKLKK